MLVDWLRRALHVTDLTIMMYFFLINGSYLVLTLLAAVESWRHLRRSGHAGLDTTYRSRLAQPVSVLVPSFNEAAGIVAATRAMQALRYPEFEIIIIDDGSTDDTFDRLQAAFDLVEVDRVIPDDLPSTGQVRSVHVPRLRSDPLVVVRKDNGGKTDALAVGINLARHPLVCMVDADSVLDPEALLRVTQPFADDPLRVVATGGVIRVANGCVVSGGRLVEARMPSTWLPRIQVVEYLRSFLLGRAGWSRLGGLLVISGAFGVFRRDLLIEIGGLDPNCIGEDAELVVRLHRYLRQHGRDYRIPFVPEPVAWTEVPSTVRVLGRQRRRWHRGITEILYKHRAMLFNPRYGRIGLLVLPYYLVFEVLAPVIEIAGIVLVPVGVLVGVVDVVFAWWFLLVAYGFAFVVNLMALTVEELTFHRYHRWWDLLLAGVASALEHAGYRQLSAFWRVHGIWSALRRSPQHWGVMVRQGLGGPR